MKWNFENGRLSFSADNTNLFSMKELTGRVELDGTFVAADDCAAHGVRWIWDVRETEAGLVVRATLKNESASMIRIGVWDVLYGKTDSLELGDNKGDVRFFCWWPWCWGLPSAPAPATSPPTCFPPSSAYCWCGSPDGWTACWKIRYIMLSAYKNKNKARGYNP